MRHTSIGRVGGRRWLRAMTAALALALALAACGGGSSSPSATPGPPTSTPGPPTPTIPASITIGSIWAEGDFIPGEYTCKGAENSPPLHWEGAPPATRSYVLFMEDPDAGGTFSHWIVYDLPDSPTELPAAIPTTGALSNGAKQGVNSRGTVGYAGPCPPRRALHHYQFFIFALDAPLNLAGGKTKREVLDAMNGHILARGMFTGSYLIP